MDVAKGVTMVEEHSLVKMILGGDGMYSGCDGCRPHGSGASAIGGLPHECEYQDLMPVIKSQVIHPTINEVLLRTFSELEHPDLQPSI